MLEILDFSTSYLITYHPCILRVSDTFTRRQPFCPTIQNRPFVTFVSRRITKGVETTAQPSQQLFLQWIFYVWELFQIADERFTYLCRLQNLPSAEALNAPLFALCQHQISEREHALLPALSWSWTKNRDPSLFHFCPSKKQQCLEVSVRSVT